MLQRQKGQAFILVLILLAVGGLLITPALNLSFTGLKGRMIQHTDLMEYYAADGAQEYSLWLLTDPVFVEALVASGESESGLYIVLNRVQAEYTITFQASLGAPSDAPLTTDKYKITVVVTPNYLPVTGVTTEFTYTITLQYMYPDVPTQPLTRLVVTFPQKFTYVAGSTTGFTTLTPSFPGSTFKWDFDPDIPFDYYEEKTMSFQATTTFSNEGTYYTAVDVRTSVPRGSTGPTAPIVVVQPTTETDIPRLKMTKTVAPEVIPPGVPTLLTYTISLENRSSFTSIAVQLLEDALPAGFQYAGGDTGFLLLDTNGPSGTYIADGTRQLLEWKFTPIGTLTVPVDNPDTPEPENMLVGTFQAIGLVDSSGTYANEIWVATSPAIYQEYSWPTGGVIVPQFDIESSSGGTTLKVVTEVSGGSHKIKSWQVE